MECDELVRIGTKPVGASPGFRHCPQGKHRVVHSIQACALVKVRSRFNATLRKPGLAPIGLGYLPLVNDFKIPQSLWRCDLRSVQLSPRILNILSFAAELFPKRVICEAIYVTLHFVVCPLRGGCKLVSELEAGRRSVV